MLLEEVKELLLKIGIDLNKPKKYFRIGNIRVFVDIEIDHDTKDFLNATIFMTSAIKEIKRMIIGIPDDSQNI